MPFEFMTGVVPALSTAFTADDKIDHDSLTKHTKLLLDAGCRGITPLGS